MIETLEEFELVETFMEAYFRLKKLPIESQERVSDRVEKLKLQIFGNNKKIEGVV